MKPTPETLAASFPDVPYGIVAGHVAHLPLKYFDYFPADEIHIQCRLLAELSACAPLVIHVEEENDEVCCTLVGVNYPFLFSLITGILFAHNFSISSGEVFTYTHTGKNIPGSDADLSKDHPLLTRRGIIDHFHGTVRTSLTLSQWRDGVAKDIHYVATLLSENAIQRARAYVNERVAAHLATMSSTVAASLDPVEITTEDAGPDATRLRVISQDTPAFLFTLSNALSLQKMSIEQVTISTRGTRIEDIITVADEGGTALHDASRREQVILAILLTKQFTYFLGNAPDPFRALTRFDALLMDIIREPDREKWVATLADPRALKELARLLGASDFLWEDFIRNQYETLLPLLEPHVGEHRFSAEPETVYGRLREAVDAAATYEEKKEVVNTFKDNEIYRIDLDHITECGCDIQTLSRRLTALAEAVVRCAADTVYAHMTARYGIPRTVSGVETPYALLGLGKCGGAALGYASDIELLFVYSDNGKTDGATPMDNGDFFHRCAKEFLAFIRTKREGVFAIDMRLRPYGSASPLATSLENFCRYYAADGDAYDYERLALVRLRAIAGDMTLGQKVERLRDTFVYESGKITVEEIQKLRKKQHKTYAKAGQFNAKFSPGGLVDVEYDVQLLQVVHGRSCPALRTPYVHMALSALADAGIVTHEEAHQLADAYYFLRTLINGLRMLRGNARDLVVPPDTSDEFAHLARRMGYTRGALSAADQLRLDIAAHTAVVRAFVLAHFGRDALPINAQGTLADVVLSTTLTDDERAAIMRSVGFQDISCALHNLQKIAGEGSTRMQVARLAVLARDTLARGADPDQALNYWEQFVRDMPDKEEHFSLLLSQPTRVEILFSLFADSQFLSNTLLHFPAWFAWLTEAETLQMRPTREELCRQFAKEGDDTDTHDTWLRRLRIFRCREMLRIGTRDIWLQCPFTDTVEALSTLADALVSLTLEKVWRDIMAHVTLQSPLDAPERHFCLMAFGKLGGKELNYSSDIDLLAVCDDVTFTCTYQGKEVTQKELYAKVVESVRTALMTHTADGQVYRVDFRLRPYGRAGELVPSVSALARYFAQDAALWECQAAMKLRPIAGNMSIGAYAYAQLAPRLYGTRAAEELFPALHTMRDVAIQRHKDSGDDIKSGMGGIRDIEFIVQGLQLLHMSRIPSVVTGATLDGIEALSCAGVLSAEDASALREDYVYLRRVEHALQLYDDRQVHSIPSSLRACTALAKRVHGHTADAAKFMAHVDACRSRVRAIYERIVCAYPANDAQDTR